MKERLESIPKQVSKFEILNEIYVLSASVSCLKFQKCLPGALVTRASCPTQYTISYSMMYKALLISRSESHPAADNLTQRRCRIAENVLLQDSQYRSQANMNFQVVVKVISVLFFVVAISRSGVGKVTHPCSYIIHTCSCAGIKHPSKRYESCHHGAA